MECGDDMVADDEVRASHGGRRNQGLLWFFGASATLGVAAVTAITCAVIRYGWNDGEFWKLVVPAAVALVAAIKESGGAGAGVFGGAHRVGGARLHASRRADA